MRKFTIACSAMLAAVATLTSLSAARASEDAQGVREANAQFYSALGAVFQGDMEPMNAVWSHEGDVTYIDGKVIDKLDTSPYGVPVVQVEIVMTTQEGEIILKGKAEVSLPA